MNSLKTHMHSILLAALVGMTLIDSFSHRWVLNPFLSDVAIAMTLLLVFMIVFHRPMNRLVAFIAVTIAIVADSARYLMPSYPEVLFRLIFHTAALLLLGFAAFVILRNIFEQHVVSADDMIGAVCGYLVAAGAWSSLFLLIEIFLPGSFSVGPGFAAGLNTWDGRIAVMSYGSLGSLTSLGAGVVVPIRPPATILTTLEAVFGQFYIAVVVARLVSARLSQTLQRNSSK